MITTPSKRSLNYPALESISDFDYNSAAFIKRMKKSGPAYLVMKVLQTFRETEKRDPLPAQREEDMKKLFAIRDQISSDAVVSNDYFDHVFAQISPSAAIVGGAVGQEIIKAVSQKEAPHYNFFFFDSQKSCGFIETIE